MDKVELLKKLLEQTKRAIKAQEESEKWNMKCMDLPPRSGGRGGRNTTIQAKASVKAEDRDRVLHVLRILMSEFIKSY